MEVKKQLFFFNNRLIHMTITYLSLYLDRTSPAIFIINIIIIVMIIISTFFIHVITLAGWNTTQKVIKKGELKNKK